MKPRVLIVDPDELLLDAYHACLARDGFEIETAANGLECVQKLYAFAPDVVVLEPETPNGWGEKVLKLLRNDGELPSVPVIVLTRGDHRFCRTPIAEFHIKPISMHDLANRIRRVVSSQVLTV